MCFIIIFEFVISRSLGLLWTFLSNFVPFRVVLGLNLALLGAIWGSFWVSLAASGRSLGITLRQLEAPWLHWGLLLGPLGATWATQRSIWGAMGLFLVPLDANLDSFGPNFRTASPNMPKYKPKTCQDRARYKRRTSPENSLSNTPRTNMGGRSRAAFLN